MKLYMIGIGGGMPSASIEVHDLKFVASESLEDTFDLLRKQWFGDSLHIDEYAIVEMVDGYLIELQEGPASDDQELYLINMGGSVKGHFGEVHEYGLMVGNSMAKLKHRAAGELLTEADDRHVDYIFKVQDKLVSADGKTRYIHLIKSDKAVTNYYLSTYLVIK